MQAAISLNAETLCWQRGFLCRAPDRDKSNLEPLIQRDSDPAEHRQRMAFVIGILKAADH